VFETPDLSSLLGAWLPILYAGMLSSGVAYTLQIVGQRNLDPTVASLIMSLESVISALSGWMILHQAMTGRELLGCALMFGAIILAQIPLPRRT
jgi:drug/metabolite transporter (DMT)-like permease